MQVSWNAGFSNNLARYSDAKDGLGAAGEGWTALQTCVGLLGLYLGVLTLFLCRVYSREAVRPFLLTSRKSADFLSRQSAAGGAVGTLRWAGLANSYYFVDQQSGVGGVILAQFSKLRKVSLESQAADVLFVVPWADAGMVALKDRFEEWVYANVKA